MLMFHPNKKHLQPSFLAGVEPPPAKQQRPLEESRAGIFNQEFFCRLKDELCALLYCDEASGSNFRSCCRWRWRLPRQVSIGASKVLTAPLFTNIGGSVL